jgi:hypothetical protein
MIINTNYSIKIINSYFNLVVKSIKLNKLNTTTSSTLHHQQQHSSSPETTTITTTSTATTTATKCDLNSIRLNLVLPSLFIPTPFIPSHDPADSIIIPRTTISSPKLSRICLSIQFKNAIYQIILKPIKLNPTTLSLISINNLSFNRIIPTTIPLDTTVTTQVTLSSLVKLYNISFAHHHPFYSHVVL